MTIDENCDSECTLKWYTIKKYKEMITTIKARTVFTFGGRKDRTYVGGFWVATNVLFFDMGGG